MFDVSWEDTSGETVAQRRERKSGKQTPSASRQRRLSFQSSKSSSSSSNSKTKPSLLDRFTGTKRDAPTKTIDPRTRDSNATITPACTDFNGKSSHSLRRRQKAPVLQELKIRSYSLEQAVDHCSVTETFLSSPSSLDDSIFSQWMGRSATAESSWCGSIIDGPSTKTTEVQPLSPHSYITRSTEVVISSADTVHPACRFSSEVRISSDGAADGDSDSEDERNATFTADTYDPETIPKGQIVSVAKVPNLSDVERSKSVKSPRLKQKSSKIRAGGSTKDARSTTVSKSGAPEIAPALTRSETWKAPDSWECPSDVSQLLPYPKAEALSIRSIASFQEPEVTHMERHILRMAAASPKIMLERLKEQWPEVTDATISQELEIEKQLWMLMGLKYLADRASGENDSKITGQEDDPGDSKRKGVQKILSLHESQAAVSILTTFNQTAQIHHLSVHPAPLSISRIHPMTIPTPLPTLPYPPSLFQKIHALPLPNLLPTTSIPALLKECHRILSPTGSIRLTLFSPSPTPSTTGPKLRTWLEENLLLNLESQFRCTNPSRLLPTWLNDAGFSLEDPRSRVRPVRFWALGPGEGGRWDRDGWNETSRGLNGLVAVVGRMLWKDIYGGFVGGKTWWWECGEIVEECGRLGTRWDCEILDVFKKPGGG